MFSLRWLLVSCIGFLIFLWAQVLPGIEELASSPSSERVLDRDAAKTKAVQLAETRLGTEPAVIVRMDLTHFSDSDAVAYLSKRKLMDGYGKSWEVKFPTDVYRADLLLSSGDWLQLFLQMQTGDLVGWRKLPSAGSGVSVAASAADGDATVPGDVTKGSLPLDKEAAQAAKTMLAEWDYAVADWEPAYSVLDGTVVFQSRKEPLGEAKLELLVKPGERLTYRVKLPESFVSSLRQQEHLGSRLSMIGYILPELVLFVLAIVYASSYAKFSSFRRGRFLAALFFVLYVLFTLNMRAGFRSKSETGLPVSDQGVTSLIVVNAIILGATAILTYFAAVGGDGLWRSMGYKLWPRWKEADYGSRVLRAMRIGYALAFIVLGAQAAILTGLQWLIGSFVSSDASQSTYNLAHSWLMPLIAWCAGLSEELLYRLFGIALFRRWLTGAARLILRREPSRRAASALTFCAMIPPSVFWAFGHVGYPIYPVYTRLIELVLLGLLFGWFMLRFGLMTAVFAHVTLDAVLVGSQLLFDGLPYDVYSGLFSLAMPALAGGAIWLLHRRSGCGQGDPYEPAIPQARS